MRVNVDANFDQKMSLIWAYFPKLHRRFRRRDEAQGTNVMLPASPRRQEVSSVHPQRYQGFHMTFAQGIILYYKPEAMCQKCIVRT